MLPELRRAAGVIALASLHGLGQPKFDSMTCEGFHPANTAARNYGRYAP
jgi:hypothetical protein